MILTMLKSKLHGATVTEANLDYVGSITIDPELMKAAEILDGEQVHVVNKNNGSRLITYTIPGKPGSGTICLNGPAARLALAGDTVMVIAYCQLSREEASGFKPRVVLLDGANRIISDK